MFVCELCEKEFMRIDVIKVGGSYWICHNCQNAIVQEAIDEKRIAANNLCRACDYSQLVPGGFACSQNMTPTECEE